MENYFQQKLEMRGVRRQVFLDYFISQEGELVDWDRIVGSNWEIRISSETEIRLGSIILPVVQITFMADQSIANRMIHLFRMHFLSAGG